MEGVLAPDAPVQILPAKSIGPPSAANMAGRQPVEVSVLFLKWKKGGYSS